MQGNVLPVQEQANKASNLESTRTDFSFLFPLTFHIQGVSQPYCWQVPYCSMFRVTNGCLLCGSKIRAEIKLINGGTTQPQFLSLHFVIWQLKMCVWCGTESYTCGSHTLLKENFQCVTVCLEKLMWTTCVCLFELPPDTRRPVSGEPGPKKQTRMGRAPVSWCKNRCPK